MPRIDKMREKHRGIANQKRQEYAVRAREGRQDIRRRANIQHVAQHVRQGGVPGPSHGLNVLFQHAGDRVRDKAERCEAYGSRSRGYEAAFAVIGKQRGKRLRGEHGNEAYGQKQQRARQAGRGRRALRQGPRRNELLL